MSSTPNVPSTPPSDPFAPNPPPVPGILITKYTNPVPSRDAALLYFFAALIFCMTFTFWAYTIFKDKQHRKKMKKLATTEAIVTGNVHDYDMLRIPPIREDGFRLGGSGSNSINSSGGSGSSPQEGRSSQSDLESHPTTMGKKSKSGIKSNTY
ncbi:unnamed protein product [Bathycoccus prasinos]|mmetsp:Transcript_4445/g.14486  ORF Transcript_4445/g.14486 Transcript_4445/m.14486 type:complete len:153 (+) Transcript_4445:62-520(+)